MTQTAIPPQMIFFNGLSGSGKEHFYDSITPADESGKPIIPKLISMTIRKKRDYEVDGQHYYFRDEDTFRNTSRATTLFVNEPFWTEQDKFIKKIDEASSTEEEKRLIQNLLNEKPSWLSEKDREVIQKEFDRIPYSHWFRNVMDILRLNAKWLYGVPVFEMEKYRNRHVIYDVIEPKYVRQMIDYLKANDYPHQAVIVHFQNPKNNFDIAAGRATMANDVAVRTMNTCDLSDYWREGLVPDFQLLSSAEESYYPFEMVDYFNRIAGDMCGIDPHKLPDGLGFRMPKDMKPEQIWDNDGSLKWGMFAKRREIVKS